MTMTKRVIRQGIALIALMGFISTASVNAASQMDATTDAATFGMVDQGGTTLPPPRPIPGGGEEE